MSTKQQQFRSRPNRPTGGGLFKSGTEVVTFSTETPFTGNRLHTQYLLAQIKQMAMANPDAQMLKDYITTIYEERNGKARFPDTYRLAKVPKFPKKATARGASVQLTIITKTEDRNRRLVSDKTALY